MQSVVLVLTPPLAGPEKAARATSPTPPAEGRAKAQNQILSVVAGILPSALPRAAWFGKSKQTHPVPPLPPASTHGRGAVTGEEAPPAAPQRCSSIAQGPRSCDWPRFPAGATQPRHGVCPGLPPASLSGRQGQGTDKLQQKPHLLFRTKRAGFGVLRTEKGPPVGNGDSGACCGGKMVASRFSRVPRVLTAASPQKQVIGEGFSPFLSPSTLKQQPRGLLLEKAQQESSRRSGGKGRGRRAGEVSARQHGVELPEQAEGLLLGHSSPPARSLRRTLGDPGRGSW